MIIRDLIKGHLHTNISVTVHDELDSTNTRAKELAESGVDGDTLIIARRQTGGRGRMGRSFFSPDGGLYMSLLLHPRFTADKALNITTAAAVAVCRAIEKLATRECQIKWVNDVYIDGRKVCGILTESKLGRDGVLAYAVLGIGINLTEPQGGFPEDIRHRAGAVFASSREDDGNRLAAAVVDEFMRLYESGVEAADFIDEYRQRSYLTGREVNVMRIHDGDSRPAVALGIDDDFGLSVRYPDGTDEVLSSGDVSVR